MTRKIFFAGTLLAYLFVIIPFASYMKNRPVAVKLGYTPEAEVLKVASGDQQLFIANYIVLKVLFYFGTLAEKRQNKVELPPEYFNMFKTLETAVKLDPYNMDAYYFTQAAFTWEVGRAKEVNRMLIYGMKYRPWDYNLPFYIGFNYAYFLKDYESAAKYMQKAAEISREPLYTTLAARYFYESGHTDLGVIFLTAMEKGAKDRKIKDIYALRKQALLAVKTLEHAVDEFKAVNHRLPADPNELVSAGILTSLPADPYGGKFFIDADGKIVSTSKFAFGSEKK